MPRGQPTKCTNEMIKALSNYIANGVAIKYAVDAVGISEDCFYKWMKLGREDKAIEKPSNYRKFFESITKIRADFISEAIENIKKSGKSRKNWQANTWLLEKLYSAGYGKDSVEVQQLFKDIEEIKRILGADLSTVDSLNVGDSNG